MVEIPKLLKEIKEQMENVQEQMEKNKKDVQEQMKDMKEQMGVLQNEKSKKEKKKQVTEDDLESAIESLKDLTMQTSYYASVSLASSVRNECAATIVQYEKWCDQLKSLRAKRNLTTQQTKLMEELEENMHDGKKKFETATDKLLCPCVIATDPVARAFFDQKMMEIPAALFWEEFEFSVASDVIEELHPNFVSAFQKIKSRRPLDNENGLRDCVITLLKRGGLTSISLEKEYNIGKYKADIALCLPDFCDYLVGVVEIKLPHAKGDPAFQGFAYLNYERKNKEKKLFEEVGDDDDDDDDDETGDEAFRKTLAKLHPSLVLAWRGLEVDIYGVIFLHTKQRGKEPGIASSLLARFSLSNADVAYAMVKWLKAKLQKLQGEAPSEFPVINIYEGIGKEKIELTYTEHIRDNVFKATVREGRESRIVKFIGDRYGQEVHEHCVKGGFAPALYSCKRLPKLHLWMIVMHCDDEFDTLYDALEDKENKIPKPEVVKKNLEEAVKWIHKGGFVHGDLRPPNILVNKAGEVHIIDFDWAGKQKVVRYPAFSMAE